MYVRQHSFKCWSAFHRPRKTTVIYIILSEVLFFSGYPTLCKPTAEKLDLAETLLLSHFLLGLELNRKNMWNAACCRHEINTEASQFPWKKKKCISQICGIWVWNSATWNETVSKEPSDQACVGHECPWWCWCCWRWLSACEHLELLQLSNTQAEFLYFPLLSPFPAVSSKIGNSLVLGLSFKFLELVRLIWC